MNDKLYFDKISKIGTHASKLKSYIYVLKDYSECNIDNADSVANILEILDLSVSEIDAIMNYV